ncbi:MAG: cytochrome c [Chloroflexota bacterium]
MKRYGLILVSFLMILSMLAACSKKTTTPTATATATKTPTATATTAPPATKTPTATATTAPPTTQPPTTTVTQTPPTGVLTGIELVRSKQCPFCHKVSANPNEPGGVVGPSWIGVWNKPVELDTGETITRTPEYFIESIKLPDAKTVKQFATLKGVMAAFLTSAKVTFTDEEIQKILDYIKSQTP